MTWLRGARSDLVQGGNFVSELEGPHALGSYD